MFSNIVADFNYAQMNALCIRWSGFNSIFLPYHLNWCYVLTEGHNGCNVTLINICANHYTKMILNLVYIYYQFDSFNKNTIVKKKRHYIIGWIYLLFNSTCLEYVECWFKLFAVILLSPNETCQTANATCTMRAKYNFSNELEENCLLKTITIRVK